MGKKILFGLGIWIACMFLMFCCSPSVNVYAETIEETETGSQDVVFLDNDDDDWDDVDEREKHMSPLVIVVLSAVVVLVILLLFLRKKKL